MNIQNESDLNSHSGASAVSLTSGAFLAVHEIFGRRKGERRVYEAGHRGWRGTALRERLKMF